MPQPILSMFRCLTLILAVGSPLFVAAKEPEIDLDKFKLTFSDEFDGNQLDTKKWQAPEMPRQGSC